METYLYLTCNCRVGFSKEGKWSRQRLSNLGLFLVPITGSASSQKNSKSIHLSYEGKQYLASKYPRQHYTQINYVWGFVFLLTLAYCDEELKMTWSSNFSLGKRNACVLLHKRTWQTLIMLFHWRGYCFFTLRIYT